MKTPAMFLGGSNINQVLACDSQPLQLLRKRVLQSPPISGCNLSTNTRWGKDPSESPMTHYDVSGQIRSDLGTPTI